ncbi:MAG TPA: hypothetical protein VND68_00995 [Chloroflexia bacterium]|jgi:hypothetical protein|nr:hypothetical protein [Chloroflexia bacterium]
MNDDSPIGACNITFYDNFVPSLKAGQYTVLVSQTLTEDNNNGSAATVPENPQEPLSQSFQVRGPRFVLDPADIHRVFPPSNSTGEYDQYLPMIVLNKRALPWEREIPWGTANDDAQPWLALLLFSDDELLPPQPPSGTSSLPPAGSQQNPTRTASFPLNNVVTATYNGVATAGPPTGTLGPSLEKLEIDEDPGTTYCNVIEMSADTFAALVPTVADLPFLAHVRQVSTDNKEPQNSPHDGWFAAVICNRFAIPPASAGAQQRNIAHLVSLEGLQGYLGTDSPQPVPSGFQKVRLISLYSWAFTCLADPQENFRQLMLDLIGPDSEQNTGLLLRLPVPLWMPAPDTPAEQVALDRLNTGYAPLSYATRSGEQTFAWYRGPLAPVLTSPFMETTDPSSPDNPSAPRSSAEALVYDPTTGLFDQSYAVAFQTGRSLALSSLPFATNLLQWRRAAHNVVDVLLELMRSPTLTPILQDEGILDANGNMTDVGVGDLAALLDANIISNAFQDFLATEFANNIASQIGQAGGFTSQDADQQAANPSTPTPAVPQDLANLMQSPTVVALLGQLSGLEVSAGGGDQFETAIMPETIVPWLARLALLYGVPFNNLVPNSAMLPVEAIRFFYVDPNWVDSLLDGALSVGIQSSRDSLFHELMRDSMHRAVDAVLSQVRDQLRNVTTQGTTAPPVAMSGFILRSAGVSGWPGLEVRAWSATDSTNPMKPLRLDRVAPSVMIAIYPDVPVRVEINEPSEGLVFGCEDEGIALRYVPGVAGATADNVGDALAPPTWLTPEAIALAQRSQPPNQGALQIAGSGGIVQALQSQFPSPQPTLSPASFAVQMVRVPEQMLFLPTDGDAT